MPPRAERAQRGFVMILLCVLLAVAGAAGAWFGLGGATTPRTALTYPDLAGHRVVPDEDAVLDDPEARDDTGGRFVVESVGLDVPLGSSRMSRNRIAPPGFTSAYVIVNLGAGDPERAAEGTVFVATHSLRGGGVAPGNYLIDVPNQQAAVRSGDLIEVSGQSYRVTETRVVPKPRIGDDEELWADRPGRLVVFTCLQNPQNTPSANNLVIIAQHT